MEDIKDLIKKIRESEEWIMEDCKALCEAAGLSDEWEAADGENFEDVIYKAAEVFGEKI